MQRLPSNNGLHQHNCASFSSLRCSNCLTLLFLILFMPFICTLPTSKKTMKKKKDWKCTILMMQSMSESIGVISLNPPAKIKAYTRCYLQNKWLDCFRQLIRKQSTTEDQFTPLSEGIWSSISHLLKEHFSNIIWLLLLKLQHTARNYPINQMKCECLYIWEVTTCSH